MNNKRLKSEHLTFWTPFSSFQRRMLKAPLLFLGPTFSRLYNANIQMIESSQIAEWFSNLKSRQLN